MRILESRGDSLERGRQSDREVIFEESSLCTTSYDTIEEFNVDSKAEYSALSSTRSQKKKLKQTTPVPL